MFKLTYRIDGDKNTSLVEYFDDIKSLGQALIHLVNNEKEEQSAMNWCGRAHWGDKVVRYQFGYKIECFNETELKNSVEAVVKEICSRLGITYNFVGWDNDALTWDIGVGTSWIKFNDNYGYYIVINKEAHDTHELTEMFSTTNKDKKKFIADSVAGIEKAFKSQLKQTANNSNSTKNSSFCRFVVGQTYMGRCKKTSQNMSIIVTKKTPQYIFYETDTGLTGRAILKYMGGHEAILIKKADNLIVSSTDKWS